MKQHSKVLVAILILLGLTACSKSPDQHIRFGMSKMASNMDTRHMTDAASFRIGRLIYQRLVDFDDQMQVIPSIASWKLINPQQYKFTLQPGLTFHNGMPLGSEDVKATYDYILDRKHGSPHRGTLAIIDHIETPDQQTVIFHLKRADALFPAYLIIGILPAELIRNNHRFEILPVGSGPFRLVEWPEEARMIVERISDKQMFEFIEVPKPLTRSLKLARGEIHMMQNNIPSELVGWLKQQPGLQVQRRHGSNFSYLGLNMEDPELSKAEIRLAMAYAIDRKQIIDYIFQQDAREAAALLPSDHWAGNPQLIPLKYQPEKARQLLQSAGYSLTHPLKLTFKTSSDPFRVRLATIIQDQLKQVGIEIEIRSYDWGTFYGDIKEGRFQLFSLSWVGIKTPDIFRYVFHSSAIPPNGANRGRYKNARVDGLIEAAEQQTSPAAQAKLYQALQTLLLEDLPYIPLWYEDHIFISNQNISGYEISADGNFDGLLTTTLKQK